MKSMRLLICFVSLSFMSVMARADIKADIDRIASSLDQRTKSDSSNTGMKQCVWTAYQDADKLLNRTYQDLSKAWIGNDSGAVERKKRLVFAQRAWIAFRDANCVLEASAMLGGSGETLVEGGCLYKATVDRIYQLEELMKQN